MLVAAVLQLHAETAGQIQGSTGRAVHGFWLNQWRAVVPALGAALHQMQGDLPFTLSPLMGLPLPTRGITHFSAGQPAWLRLTTLHGDLSRPLLETWLPRLPAQIELAGSRWTVQTIALTLAQHPWAGQTDYYSLVNHHLTNPTPPRSWTLEFVTPTTFHSSADAYLPFPLPDALVSSWLRRWQTWSSHPLPEDIRAAVRESLHISAYELKTVPVRHGPRLAIGCVGHLTLSAGAQLDDDARALVSLLADYAFFTGSGHHTTQGMGLTCLLEHR